MWRRFFADNHHLRGGREAAAMVGLGEHLKGGNGGHLKRSAERPPARGEVQSIATASISPFDAPYPIVVVGCEEVQDPLSPSCAPLPVPSFEKSGRV